MSVDATTTQEPKPVTGRRYRVFSPVRIAALALNTLTDLTRQKVFYFITIFALILIGSSVFLARFTFQQELQILKDISLGAISIFSSTLAILATARLIPQDLEDHIAYTILAKPVPRFEYVVGKLLGVFALLAISFALMTVLFLATLYTREQSILHETAQQYASAPPEQLDAALRAVRDAGFSAGITAAIVLLYLKACVLASLTILVTTFATSNIFTVMMMVFVYLIGHLQNAAREYWLGQHSAGWITRFFMAVVALAFPDLQAFNLVDAVAAGTAVPPAIFERAAGLGFFYIAVYALLAIVMFAGKEL